MARHIAIKEKFFTRGKGEVREREREKRWKQIKKGTSTCL